MIHVLEWAPSAHQSIASARLSAAPSPQNAGAGADAGEVERGELSASGRTSAMAPAVQLTFPPECDPCVAGQRPGFATDKALHLDIASPA